MADNLFNPPKKVTMNLVGLDGNAISLLTEFQRAARKQGWTSEEIQEVQEYAKNGEYNHVLRVLMAHTEPGDDDDYDDDYELR